VVTEPGYYVNLPKRPRGLSERDAERPPRSGWGARQMSQPVATPARRTMPSKAR
jgi:hypothetical protein